MNYLQTEDIQRRLWRRKRHWFHGPPEIKVIGKPKSFGILLFDFGDETVAWNIYLNDIQDVFQKAHEAIETFVDYEHERMKQ